MQKRLIWNKDNLTALLAAAGGCITMVAAGPLLFVLPLFGFHVSSPITVQILPLPIALNLALVGYVGGAFLGASIPWFFGQEEREAFPFMLAVAALAGAVGGFLCVPWFLGQSLVVLTKLIKFIGFYTIAVMALSYLPVFVISFCTTRLASLIRLPRPASVFIRFLVTLLGFAVVLVCLRLSASPSWPAQGNDVERTDWCRRQLGKPFERLLQNLQASPALQNLLGSGFALAASHTKESSLLFNNTSQYLRADFEARGTKGLAIIEAWISSPYIKSNPPTYQISVKISSETIFITPDGALDARLMATNGRSTAADLHDRVLALFAAKKYEEITRAVENRSFISSTGVDDPMVQIDVVMAIAKSYEFLKKNQQAAAYYVMGASLLQYNLKPDRDRAMHLAEKALSLDPTNISAQMIVHPQKRAPGGVEKTLTHLIDAHAEQRRSQIQAQAKSSMAVEWQRYKPIYEMFGMSEAWSLMESGKCESAEKLLNKPAYYEKLEKNVGAASRAQTIKIGMRLCYERSGNTAKAASYK